MFSGFESGRRNSCKISWVAVKELKYITIIPKPYYLLYIHMNSFQKDGGQSKARLAVSCWFLLLFCGFCLVFFSSACFVGYLWLFASVLHLTPAARIFYAFAWNPIPSGREVSPKTWILLVSTYWEPPFLSKTVPPQEPVKVYTCMYA